MTSPKIDSEHDDMSGILFINFEIKQDSLENFSIDLIKHYWVSGSFKASVLPSEAGDKELEFQLLNENKQLLGRVFMKNPLKTSQEIFSPDGTIERKQISLKRAALTLRANVSQKVTFVAVNDAKKRLSLIELK
ncbi:hypothetical protein [Ekhidna sp.]|uniref:hypothetical protein n=1 Tax=Ekhidna sp. TaxID=2608089 RepID=UPI003BAC51B1